MRALSHEIQCLAKNRSISPRLTHRVTLKQIADDLGVGMMTVFRALNRPHLVAEPLRQRILNTVRRKGYVPNRAASGLASGGVPLIPVIIPTLHHSVYVSLLDGVHSVLPKAGLEILVSCTEYMLDSEERLVTDLLGWNPRGMILSGIDHSPGTVAKLKNAGIPIFFGNDDLAAGALFECQRRSIKVPEQIAISGF
jgi:LacI family gluconate utilization system Gnt-I transcriptional repressor